MSGAARSALVLALLISRASWALDPEPLITQYVHDRWTTDEGLPQTGIEALLQTRDGYLWIGTQLGLARFDGIRFKVFSPANTPELADGSVNALHEDRHGALWIGTRSGLIRYREGRFVRLGAEQGVPNRTIRSIVEQGDTLWIGTYGEGIGRIVGDRFERITPKGDAIDPFVTSLLVDRSGDLWIGTLKGIVQLHDGVAIGHRVGSAAPQSGTGSLVEDRAGMLWAGSTAGLVRWNGDRFEIIEGTAGLMVLSLKIDRDGVVWFGTMDHGLMRLHAGKVSRFSTEKGLTSAMVRALWEDREGSLWIGAFGGGLHRFRDGRFVVYGEPEGMANEQTGSVRETRDGAIWIGTWGGGIFRLRDGALRRFSSSEGLPSEHVEALDEDPAGHLWIGTTRGIARFDGERFTSDRSAADVGNRLVRAMLHDREGRRWVGSTYEGLSVTRERPEEREAIERIHREDTHGLLEDRRGDIWIATGESGLFRIAKGTVAQWTTREGLPSDSIDALHEDPGGALWIGTTRGLARLEGEKLHRFRAEDGLAGIMIFRILEDASGDLWLGSSNGVLRVPRRELERIAAGRTEPAQLTVYGRADGLRSIDCNGGSQPAGWRSRDGRLWFPTAKGVAVIDPARSIRDLPPPPVLIEEIWVDGRAAPWNGRGDGDSIDLGSGARAVELRYTALGLAAAERIQFKYRLEGFDGDWIDAGARRAAFYTNLPPRSYRFQVIASNGDGVWNEAGAMLTFVVRPRFHQTGWFYALCAIGIVLLGAGALRLRTRRFEIRERELAEEVAVRTRELTERNRVLDETLASLKTTQADLVRAERMASVATLVRGIAHELNNPIGFVAGNVEPLRRYVTFLVDAIRAISDGAARSREELDRILRLGPKGDLDFVVRDLESLLDDIAEGTRRAKLIVHDLQCLTTAPQRALEEVNLATIVRQTIGLLGPRLDGIAVSTELEEIPVTARAGQLEQVLVNLVDNAARAVPTKGGTIAIRVARDEEGSSVISVRDNGAGMAEEVRQRACEPFFTTRKAGEGSGLGLAIVTSIVRGHGGAMTITSAPGEGTEVKIRLSHAETPSADGST